MRGRAERGVALAVVAVVIAVSGALVVLAGALQHMRAERAHAAALDDRLAAVGDALVDFAMRHKRLPCPAGEDGLEAGAPGACGEAGAVPWRVLALPEAAARDPRGGTIRYRVAAALTAERALLGLSPEQAGGDAFALGEGRVRALGVSALFASARLQSRSGAGLEKPDRL